MRAKCFRDKEDWDNAIKDIQKVLIKEPNNEEANEILIRTFVEAGKLEDAIESNGILILHPSVECTGSSIIFFKWEGSY